MMNSRTHQLRLVHRCLLGAAGLALSSGTAQAQSDWTKRFRIGLVTALNIEAEFSLVGDFGVSGVSPGQPGVGGLNHTYDDGQVLIDATGNAGGFTSNWGYQNASQYDATAHTLTFHGTRSFDQSGSQSSVTDEPYFGLDLAYGGRLADIAAGVLGWEFGFAFVPLRLEDAAPQTVSAQRVEHRFSTGGIVLPGAPYNGGASGIGPVIGDIATEAALSATTGQLTGSRLMEANLLDFRLGPNLQWHLGGRWAMSVAGGAVLRLVTGDYSFNEQIVFASGGVANNAGGFGATEFVYGGYGEAMLYYRTEEAAEIFVGAQYVSTGDMTFSGEGREARLKLGNGLFFTAGVHWIF